MTSLNTDRSITVSWTNKIIKLYDGSLHKLLSSEILSAFYVLRNVLITCFLCANHFARSKKDI